jgi:hypothetical protein
MFLTVTSSEVSGIVNVDLATYPDSSLLFKIARFLLHDNIEVYEVLIYLGNIVLISGLLVDDGDNDDKPCESVSSLKAFDDGKSIFRTIPLSAVTVVQFILLSVSVASLACWVCLVNVKRKKCLS